MHTFRCVEALCPHWYAEQIFIENAIKTKTNTPPIGVNGRKHIKMNTLTENIAGAFAQSMRIDLNLRNNVQFYRFRTF